MYFYTDVVFKHSLDTTNHPSIINRDRAELQKHFDDSIPALLGPMLEQLNKNSTLARLDIEKIGAVDPIEAINSFTKERIAQAKLTGEVPF